MGTHPIFESDFDCLTGMAEEDKNLLGIKFGSDKWKYAHPTTVEYPAEHVRKNDRGNPVLSNSTSSDSLYGKPDVDYWEEGIIKGIQTTLTKGIIENSWSQIAWEVNEKEFRQNAPPVPIFSTNACSYPRDGSPSDCWVLGWLPMEQMVFKEEF